MSRSPPSPSGRQAKRVRFDNRANVQHQTGIAHIRSQYNEPVTIYNTVPTNDPKGVEDKVLKGILASLAFPGMLDRRDNIAEPHENTCKWIFDHEEYLTWSSSCHGLLWIKGNPGSGKSTLMAALYRDFYKNDQMNEAIRLDFFFNARGSELQHSPLGMLRSLLNQLLRQSPQVVPAVETSYLDKCAAYGADASTWEWQQADLERLLANALIVASERHQVVVFVDAIDEAGEQAAKHVANYLHQVHGRCSHAANEGKAISLKFCLSSRHYPIASSIRGTEIWVERNNRDDIAAVIHAELSTAISALEDGSDFGGWKTIERNMLEQSKGIFQWVRLALAVVIEELENGGSLDSTRKLLQDLPPKLEEVYTFILQSVIHRKNIAQSLSLFQWICVACEPLSIQEVGCILSSANSLSQPSFWSGSDISIRKRIKALSGGLIEVIDVADTKVSTNQRSAHVQVIHQTVGEYLIQKGLTILHRLQRESGPLPHTNSKFDSARLVEECHAESYRYCLHYFDSFDTDIIRDAAVYILQRRFGFELDNQSKISAQSSYCLVFLDYATKYVFEHARRSSHHRKLDQESVLRGEHEIDIIERIRSRWIISFQCIVPQNNRFPASDSSVCHIAANFGLTDVVQHCIERQGPFDTQDSQGHTPLHLASLKGHESVSALLLKAGARTNTSSRSKSELGTSPLAGAAAHGRLEMVNLLLANGADVNFAEPGNLTALITAARGGELAVVKTLIKAGANLNISGGRHCDTALHTAIRTRSSNHSEVVQELLTAGADMNAPGGFFGTPFQVAAYEGDEKVVRLFLDHKLGHDMPEDAIGLALEAASQAGKETVVQMLLDHIRFAPGTDVHAEHHVTALWVAIAADDGNAVRRLLGAQARTITRGRLNLGPALRMACKHGDEVLVQMCLDAGADIHASDFMHRTALHRASEGGHEGVVRILLDTGADVNATDRFDNTALHEASEGGHEGVVRILLNAGADFNATYGFHSTALHRASEGGHEGVVRILLDAGADVNATNEWGDTALDLVRKYGRGGVVQMLLEAENSSNDSNLEKDGILTS